MLPSAEGAAAIAEHSYNYFSSNNDHGEDRTQMVSMAYYINISEVLLLIHRQGT
jgi:hypothetical protein